MKKWLFLPHTILCKILLNIFGIKTGRSLITYGIPYIIKDKSSELKMGSNVTIVSNSLGNLLGINHRSIIVAREGARIKIGNNVGISGSTIYSLKSIVIEDYVNIGANCKLIDHDFHPLEPIARMQDKREMIRKSTIHIKKNVFIGTDSIILQGTVIGENSIIGAKSVVKGNFPDNCIIAGNPAKIVRYLTKEELKN